MKQNKRTSKGSNEKIHTFEVGDIVKIVSNHKPFSRSYITNKYPHSKQKENLGLLCFVEHSLPDRYSLYALEQPVKPCPEKCNHDLCKGIDELGNPINCQWYYGDILGSCLEYVRKITTEELENYKHFIYSDDLEYVLCRIKQQKIEEAQL